MAKSLESLLVELGDLSLALYDPFVHGLRFPIVGDHLVRVRSATKKIIEPIQGKKFRKIGNYFARSLREFQEITYRRRDLGIAGRMFNHDLRIHWGVVALQSDPMFYSRLSEEERSSEEYLNVLLRELTHIRLFMSTMAYLGTSGRKKFLDSLPVNQIGFLLNGVFKPNIRVEFNGNEEMMIRNTMYACICELVSNALRYQHVSETPDICVNFSSQESPSKQKYFVTQVGDNARGLGDEKGEPISHNAARELFGSYSTSGGGLGLQVVDALLGLANRRRGERGGHGYYVDVISRVQDHNYLYYLPDSDIYAFGKSAIKKVKFPDWHVPPIFPECKHGACFRLMCPADEKIPG